MALPVIKGVKTPNERFAGAGKTPASTQTPKKGKKGGKKKDAGKKKGAKKPVTQP